MSRAGLPSVTVLALVVLFAIYAFIAAGTEAAQAFSSAKAGPALGHLLLGPADLAAAILPLVLAGCTSTAGQPGAGTGTTTAAARSGSAAPGGRPGLPAVRQVWVIELENQGYAQSFGTPSADLYLARTLLRMGVAGIALSAVARGMLGLLRMCQRHPGRVDGATVDQLAEAELRLLDVPAPEAARLAALPLPPIKARARPATT